MTKESSLSDDALTLGFAGTLSAEGWVGPGSGAAFVRAGRIGRGTS